MLNIAFISLMRDLIAPAFEFTATSEVASGGAFYRQPPCCRLCDLNRVLCDEREGGLHCLCFDRIEANPKLAGTGAVKSWA
jgi:hypothetical protein